jgi:hypothetical protein
MFPSNDSGITLAAVFKWLAIIFGGVFLFQAYQGIITKSGGGGRGGGEYLTGDAAVAWGWWHVLYAVISFALSWAIWFFWQRNED